MKCEHEKKYSTLLQELNLAFKMAFTFSITCVYIWKYSAYCPTAKLYTYTLCVQQTRIKRLNCGQGWLMTMKMANKTTMMASIEAMKWTFSVIKHQWKWSRTSHTRSFSLKIVSRLRCIARKCEPVLLLLYIWVCVCVLFMLNKHFVCHSIYY